MNYQPKANKAYSLISKYGSEISVSRPGSSADWVKSYNAADQRYQWDYAGSADPAPASPVYSAPTGTATTFSGVGVQTAWSTYAFSAGVATMGDIKLITQTAQEIKENDVISMNGNTYVASQPITKVSPDAGLIIVQEVNCRNV